MSNNFNHFADAASRAEFNGLLEKLCEQQLSEEGRQRLEHYLRLDQVWRRHYLDYVGLHATLHLVGSDPDAKRHGAQSFALHPWLKPLSAGETSPAAADVGAAGPVGPAPIFPPSESGFPVFPPPSSEQTGGWGMSNWSIILLGLTLIGLSTAGGWWLMGGRSGRHQHDPKLVVETGAEAELDSMPAATGECDFPEISGLEFHAGVAKLYLDKIGYVVFDGNADFRLIGPKRARLNRGRILMRVTDETGHGFVVEAPDGTEVLDLGTEFALDVTDGKPTGFVVFEGAVDVLSPGQQHARRLNAGEGLDFSAGEPGRLSSIIRGTSPTFRRSSELQPGDVVPLVIDVVDNLKSNGKRFYEIVPGGFGEDVKAFVDRPHHEWNGLTGNGLPEYLIGADYIRTFNDDKVAGGREITVTLGRPARLYVLFDERHQSPEWLVREFRRTGDFVGLDVGPNPPHRGGWARGDGPGNSIEVTMAVWERVVTEPGPVVLGACPPNREQAMYGIAALPLEVDTEPN